MKIKMITLYAGPLGVMESGQTYEVAAEIGQALVDGRFAVAVAEASLPAVAVETVPEIETGGLTVEAMEKAVPARSSKKK